MPLQYQGHIAEGSDPVKLFPMRSMVEFGVNRLLSSDGIVPLKLLNETFRATGGSSERGSVVLETRKEVASMLPKSVSAKKIRSRYRMYSSLVASLVSFSMLTTSCLAGMPTVVQLGR
jgi:hypothetical protein